MISYTNGNWSVSTNQTVCILLLCRLTFIRWTRFWPISRNPSRTHESIRNSNPKDRLRCTDQRPKYRMELYWNRFWSVSLGKCLVMHQPRVDQPRQAQPQPHRLLRLTRNHQNKRKKKKKTAYYFACAAVHVSFVFSPRFFSLLFCCWLIEFRAKYL